MFYLDLSLVGAVDAISCGVILYSSFEMLKGEFGLIKGFLNELLKFICLLCGAGMILGLFFFHLSGGSHGGDVHHG